MIRTDYYNDEDLKSYADYGIEKTEVVKSEYGDRKYVTFGKGLVVGYGDTYLGDGDSVWYVKIWNPIKKTEGHIGMGYVNSWPGNHENVTYDATPEVKAEWEAWAAEQEKIRRQKEKERAEQERKWRDEQEAKTPNRGKTVKVVRGRKLPKGLIGKVFWRGQSKFGTRIGIEVMDGVRVFTAESNVEVVQ